MKIFNSQKDAESFKNMKNTAFRKANNYKDSVCVVPFGNQFAVVDLKTGIETGLKIIY